MNLKTLTITEAVKATGLPRSTIYRLLDSGAVSGNQLGRTRYISAESLYAWINRKVEPPTPIAAPIDEENPFL